jgi:hypothetical protein
MQSGDETGDESPDPMVVESTARRQRARDPSIYRIFKWKAPIQFICRMGIDATAMAGSANHRRPKEQRKMKPRKTSKSSSQTKTGSQQHGVSQVKTSSLQTPPAKPAPGGKPSGSHK